MGIDSTAGSLIALSVTFTVISPVVTGLRFYARYSRKQTCGIDDWLVIPALLTLIGAAVLVLIGVHDKVLGYPTPKVPGSEGSPTIPNSNWTTASRLEWIFFLLQIPCRGFVKLSYVFFFRRIFVAGRTTFNTVSMLSAIVLALWTLAFFLWFLFACDGDFAARWDTVASFYRHCPTARKSPLLLDISDSLTDLLVLLLPIPMVVRLNMRISRKLSVLGIFGLGAAALAASIVRLVIFLDVLTPLPYGRLVKVTIDSDLLEARGLYWSILESGLGLIGCCLPTLNVLFRDMSAPHRLLRAVRLEWERKGLERKDLERKGSSSSLRVEDGWPTPTEWMANRVPSSSEGSSMSQLELGSHETVPVPGFMPALIAPGVETKRHLIETYMP